MSVKKKTVFIISLITVFIAGTLYADKWEQSYEEEYETKTLLINSSLADCVGVSPRKCMLIREAESDEWKFFYDEIENFFYKEGYFYEITVRVTEIDNPPIDGSSKKYMLTEIISRTNLYSQSADILYNLLKSHTVIPKEN